MAPGQFDSVPTPDAHFLTIPAPLRFFSLTKIWADTNNATNLQPDFSDESMQDEYQSLGIVDDSQSTRTYRVVTGFECTLVQDLGFKTGKVAFSYSSRLL